MPVYGPPIGPIVQSAIQSEASGRDAAIRARNVRQPRVADGVFSMVDAALDSGRSAAIQVQGDSTGNGTDEWVYLLGQWLAARHVSAHVKYTLWADSGQRYDAWTTVQAGTTGERHAYFPANARTFKLPATAVTSITGDIDLRVRVALDNYLSGVTQTLVCKAGSAGTRSIYFQLNSSGFPQMNWSTDGTALTTVTSGTKPTVANGAQIWLRATLDVDNGIGGRTYTFYSSTDGVTWTSLGTGASTSGITSIFDATAQDWEIGGRGFNSELAYGKFYEVQIRNGIDGVIVNPQPIDSWVPRVASSPYVAGTFGGSPTLYIINGSHPGAPYTYLADTTRHPKMVRPFFGSLVIQSCSHNDGENVGAAYLAARDAWLALTDARAPGSQTVLVTQNPQQAPVDPVSITDHARRRLLLMAWAARRGLVVIDTWRRFLDWPLGAPAITLTDGVHPTPKTTGDGTSGQEIWLAAVTDAWETSSPANPLGAVVPFAADFANNGTGDYAIVTTPEHITIVDDPVLGSARKVARFEVYNTDISLTANPRAQLQLDTAGVHGFQNGSEFWTGTGVYLPSDFPVMPTVSGQTTWMVLHEVYGWPHISQSAAQFCLYSTQPDKYVFNINVDSPANGLVTGFFVNHVWTMSLLRSQWVDIAFHVKISTDPTIGFYELFINTGAGWAQQLLSGQRRLYFSTLNYSHNIGPNVPTIKQYRRVDMITTPVVNYFAGQKIGASLADVDMHSFG